MLRMVSRTIHAMLLMINTHYDHNLRGFSPTWKQLRKENGRVLGDIVWTEISLYQNDAMKKAGRKRIAPHLSIVVERALLGPVKLARWYLLALSNQIS